MVLNFFVLTISILLNHCGPQGGSGSTARSGTSSISSSKDASGKKGSTGVTGSNSRSGTSSNANEEPVRKEVLESLGDDASVEQLKKLTIGELRLLLAERKNQDRAEEEQLELLAAMNVGLCEKLNDIRENCPAIARLAASGLTKTLQCDGSLMQEEAGSGDIIEVSIPEGVQGKYILLANDKYQSSVFGAGKTEIKFRSISGSDMLAPKFLSVYKLVLRSATAGVALPPKNTFDLRIDVNGNKLIHSQLYSSEDPKHLAEGTEYKLDVSQILAVRDSSKCKVDLAEINAFKANIRQTVEANQAQRRTQEYMKEKELQEGQ